MNIPQYYQSYDLHRGCSQVRKLSAGVPKLREHVNDFNIFSTIDKGMKSTVCF